MKLLILSLLTIAVSSKKERFELVLSVLDREAFLENIVKSVQAVSSPGECAFHCDGHQDCSAFGFNTISKVCQLLGDVVLSDSAQSAPWLQGQRYYFIRKAWCPVEQGFLYSRTGLCLILTDSKTSWNEAVGICNSLGGRLTVLNSEDKRNAAFSSLKRLGKDSVLYWVGSSDAAVDGEWVWSDGTVMSTDWFLETEPNGGIDENCLLIYQEKAADAPCDGFLLQSLCEILGN